MKKSLFRFGNRLELCAGYVLCFCIKLLFDYAKTLDISSYILKSFLKGFMEYQILITCLFTFIVIVFHYQMLHRKKTEIYCRILVGDTILNITIRYFGDCLLILGFVYVVFIFINVGLRFNLTSNFDLVFIFITYILISASQVRKYENF